MSLLGLVSMVDDYQHDGCVYRYQLSDENTVSPSRKRTKVSVERNRKVILNEVIRGQTSRTLTCC